MTREEDFELVRRLQSRDPSAREAAFDSLYRKYERQVFNLSARILNDRNLAADAVQATFLTVLRKSRKFRFRSAFSSWLYRITFNQCIDLKRRRARLPRLSVSEPEVAGQIGDKSRTREPEPGPVERARQSELRTAIDKAVADLDPRMAAVVTLRYGEGMEYGEIAEILDLPLGTIKSRLNRAHAALDAALRPRLDDIS